VREKSSGCLIDAATAGARDHWAMSADPDPSRLRLMLDLDRATGAPSGRLVDERGSAIPFFGWLQLMDGLEGARQRAASNEAPEPSDEGGQGAHPDP
jgi:hypothetical protein